MEAPIQVTARTRLGSMEYESREFQPGVSIQDIEQAMELPYTIRKYGKATLGSIEIPADRWHLVKPKAGSMLAFSPLAQGGAAASFLTTAALALGSGGGSVAASAGVNFIFSAFAIVGALGQSGLLNTNSHKSGGVPTPSSREAFSAGVGINELAPYEQIPTVLGKIRVAPGVLVPKQVSQSNSKATVTGVVGLAGQHEISDIKVNGTAIDEIANVTYNALPGSPYDPPMSIVTTTVLQEEVDKPMPRHNVTTLSNATRWALKTAQDENDNTQDSVDYPQRMHFAGRVKPDRIVFNFTMPNGLIEHATAGFAGVPIRIGITGPDDDDSTIYMPECHMLAKIAAPLFPRIRIVFDTIPGSVQGVPANGFLFEQAFANVATAALTDWQANAASFGTSVSASGVDVTDWDSIDLYVQPDDHPKDAYRIFVQAGSPYDAGTHNTTNYTYNAGADDNAPEFFRHMEYSSVPHSTGDYAAYANEISLTRISYEWDDEPLNTDDLALVEFSATDLDVESLTFMAHRVVQKRWTGSEWITAPHATSNPAELMYEVLTGNVNAKPLGAAIVDDASLGAWADYCTDNGLECNAFIQSGTVDDALRILQRAGHGLLNRGQTWGISIDKDRSAETPTQLFSPRNTRNFNITRKFDDFPHAIRATFLDEDNEYRLTERVVYYDGFDASSATLYESQDYTAGITNADAVDLLALRYMRALRERANTYSFETDARSMIASRGTLVGMAHYTLSTAHFYAFVRDVRRETIGGVTKIVGLELDGSMDMALGSDDIFSYGDMFAELDIFSGATPGVAIETRDGTVTTAQVNETSTRTSITFLTPLTDDADILEGVHVTGGTLTAEYRRCIVSDIRQGPNFTARVQLTDEAPAIFA